MDASTDIQEIELPKRFQRIKRNVKREKKKGVSILLPENLYKELCRAAVYTGNSKTEIVIQALEALFEE